MEGDRFLITGLPRSRTAWFSAFMTASGYYCIHEGLNGCKSVSEYKGKIKYASDANTGYAYTGQIIDDRPTVIIHKYNHETPAGVVSSLKSIKGLHILFDEIDERIAEIFSYLTGDKIDMKIYNVFKNLNITTMAVMDLPAAEALLNETSKQT